MHLSVKKEICNPYLLYLHFETQQIREKFERSIRSEQLHEQGTRPSIIINKIDYEHILTVKK